MYLKQGGVTLLELLLTLGVLSILSVVAIPAWQSTLAYGHRAAALNSLRAGLALAQESAITRGQPVALCTSADHLNCDNGDWEDGWIVFVDRNGDYQRDAAEPILRVHAALAVGSGHLRGNRLIAHKVGFQRDGLMHGVHNGTITYASVPPRTALRRCLIVARSGRIRTDNGNNCHGP